MTALIEKQVNGLIEETRQVAGVQHVFVASRQGMILGSWSETKRDAFVLDRACMHIVRILGAMQKQGGKLVEIESQYQHGAMLVHDLGNAFAVFIHASTMNLSMFRMTLNVAETQFAQDANLQKELAQLTRFSDALQVMDTLAYELIEELASRGIGSNKMAERLTPRVAKLQTEFACLNKVSVSHRGVDLSSLVHSDHPSREIVSAWGRIVFAICACAATDEGEAAVAKKYRAIAAKALRQDKKIFDDMGLTNVIPKLEGPVSFET